MAKTPKSLKADQLDLFDYIPRHDNDSNLLRSDGREALAGAPAQDGSGTGDEGAARRDDSERGGPDPKRHGEHYPTIDFTAGIQAGGRGAGGLGTGSGTVYSVATGSRVETSSGNYRITDADLIGVGGIKQKFKQNVAAIEALRQIEAEDRTATPAEQAILVKYVGWGGMPQVFAEVPPDDWRQEHGRIAELLTKDEFAAARASTVNAHYTAPEVIRAMYAAVERLGFHGGRILEPACGLGHFVGLMPDAMERDSVVTGIELDSLTSRIAQKLYPGRDIRQGGYEEAQLSDNAYDLAISVAQYRVQG
jgi:hypothetical protein